MSDDDYIISTDNHEQAVAEIVRLIVGEETSQAEALRDYANRLIKESAPESWSKKELEAALAAYSDGLRDAR
jgi:hypothetical protein